MFQRLCLTQRTPNPVAISALLMTLLTSMGIAERSFADKRCSPAAATLESLEGQVKWRSSTHTDWQNAAIGMHFCYGDQIHISQYRAALRLENDTLVKLEENSLLHLVAPKQGFWVELLQGAGHFLSRTPKAFEVKAPYLNAAVDGTEFIVSAAASANTVSVIEGQVTLSNELNSRVLTNNQQASGTKNNTLSATNTLTLKDSATWVLYFPALFSVDSSNPAVQIALANSDYSQALSLLQEQPTRAGQLALSASIHLLLGDLSAAQKQLKTAFQLDPNSPDANAVAAFMVLITQDGDSALEKTNALVKQHPNNTNVLLAHSFALQSKGQQAQAMQYAKRALNSTQNPDTVTLANLPLVARYAELLLNNQYYRQAEALIQEALTVTPKHSQLNTLAGFISLNQFNSEAAAEHFYSAITTDSNNALSHFGLAMTLIQSGQLQQGQQALELAVILDPTNSLYRSYLGKTYFEEHKSEWASTQYALAKQFDPNDPTPWLYDAHLLKQQGKLQETIVSLETSKRLNDNRAVYRSRFLLDNDIAAKNANLTNVYLDLNIEQVAKAQAGLAATQNPTEFASHRAASLAYRQDNNAQVLQKNEATLTRLLQPIGAQALPVGVGQPAIVAYGWLSPNEIGTNEYSSLFAKRGVSGNVTGYLGTQQSNGYDWQTQAIGQTISASVGQYNYGSDGFADNNDFDINYREANIHVQPIQAVKFMAHLNRATIKTGDIAHAVDSEIYDKTYRKNEESDEKSIGTKIQLSPNDVILGIYSEYDIEGNVSNQFSPFPGLVIQSFIEQDTEQNRKEVQWNKRLGHTNLTLGHSKERILIRATPKTAAFDPTNELLENIVDSAHNNTYFRLNTITNYNLQYLTGIGYTKWNDKAPKKSNEELNYELGMLFNLTKELSISVANWRISSEHTPRLGSLKNNFIYDISTTNSNAAFNRTDSRALNLSWMPNSGSFTYTAYKSKNSDNIDLTNNSSRNQYNNEVTHRLSGNIATLTRSSITANYEYKNIESPVNEATTANSAIAANHQHLLLSINQQFRSNYSAIIEWGIFKQQQDFINKETSGNQNIETTEDKKTTHQTNAKLKYSSNSHFNIQLTAYNIFNDDAPIESSSIQRKSQDIMPTTINVPSKRSLSLSVKYQF